MKQSLWVRLFLEELQWLMISQSSAIQHEHLFLWLKGIVHPKMNPRVIQTCMNVFVLLNTKEDILKNVETEQFWIIVFVSLLWKSMVPKTADYKLSPKYLPLCSAEQTHSYRSGNTRGWVNDRIFIFGWTVPLTFTCSIFFPKTIIPTMLQNYSECNISVLGLLLHIKWNIKFVHCILGIR